MYYTGLGVEQNYKEAFNWYKKAADKENAQAQLRFIVFLATDVVRKTAEQGDVKAQSVLSELYRKGVYVEQNYAEAFNFPCFFLSPGLLKSIASPF